MGGGEWVVVGGWCVNLFSFSTLVQTRPSVLDSNWDQAEQDISTFSSIFSTGKCDKQCLSINILYGGEKRIFSDTSVFHWCKMLEMRKMDKYS